MAKVKLKNPEILKEFINKNSKIIINAELDTYRESDVSSFEPRIYMFTPFSVGIATVGFPDNVAPIAVYVDAIAKFKSEERNALSELGKELYDESGGKAPITALLSVIPTKAVKIDKNEMENLEPELRQAIEENKMTPELMETFADGKYKTRVGITVMVQLDSFFTNMLYVYEVIPHDNEVLDIKLIHTADLSKDPAGYGAMNSIYKLIEVEE